MYMCVRKSLYMHICVPLSPMAMATAQLDTVLAHRHRAVMPSHSSISPSGSGSPWLISNC